MLNDKIRCQKCQSKISQNCLVVKEDNIFCPLCGYSLFYNEQENQTDNKRLLKRIRDKYPDNPFLIFLWVLSGAILILPSYLLILVALDNSLIFKLFNFKYLLYYYEISAAISILIIFAILYSFAKIIKLLLLINNNLKNKFDHWIVNYSQPHSIKR